MSTSASELHRSFSATVLPSFGGYLTQEGVLEGVTFWPRVAARAIDLIAHYVLRYSAGTMFGLMLVLAAGGRIPIPIILKLRHARFTEFIFSIAGFLAYQIIFTVVHGSTVGKRLLSMVVIQEDASPCGFKSAVIRELSYFVDALFFGLVGYTAMQGSVQQQRHGDEWARTVVAKRSQIAPEKLRGAGRFAVALVFAFAADLALVMVGLLVAIAF